MESGSPKIYTRTGDKGTTSLIGGTRVSKANLRLDAYGSLDETNSWLGVMMSEVLRAPGLKLELVRLAPFIARIQSDLFDIGSHLACEDDQLRMKLPRVESAHIKELELMMDELSRELKPLKNFVLPGGTPAAATAHIARTVCRRTERLAVGLSEADSGGTHIENEIIQYLNRLSDFLFVLARHFNRVEGVDEPIWSPRKTLAGR